jgi:hypothetical protein
MFDSRSFQIFWEVVGLERGLLSLVSTLEELLGRKTRDFGLENREYGHRDPLCWPRNIPYLPKLALTSPTSSGRSVGIVLSQTQATEFVRFVNFLARLATVSFWRRTVFHGMRQDDYDTEVKREHFDRSVLSARRKTRSMNGIIDRKICSSINPFNIVFI